jgi:excinuclease UvrABC nuclease subunit
MAEDLAAIPESYGIYAFSVPGNSPHLSWSINLNRRLSRLLAPARKGRDGLLAAYREKVDCIRCWPAGSRLEISLLMYELARDYYPDDYRKRLHLRLPWFVRLAGGDAFPRLEVVNRLSRKSTAAFGPFSSRELTQRYEQEVLGLFQIRRCTEVLTPHPGHPGCIYGEMNQCLRPCQCAVSGQEYASEAERVFSFLSSNGKSSFNALSAARERASTELDFEQAAQLHKRLEKISAAAACRDPVITAIEELNGVALARGIGKRHFRLWPMLRGFWQAPVDLDVSSEEPQAKSLDGKIRESLSQALAVVQAAGNRAEQIAIFSRWYYSSWRDGQWFPFRTLDDLNYRRLVREVSNMAKSEARP